MRVLVTGATGFIGRHLLERMANGARPEYEVIGLVRRKPLTPVAGVSYVEQELTQPLDLARLPQRVDVVIHQAALIEADAAVKGAQDDALPFLANVVATWRLLRYAEQAGARSFVYASTGGVYGCGNRPFVEDDPFNPLDLYSLTKSQAELAVRHTATTFPKIVLRYFFPYGMGTPNPIPSVVQRALRGEAIAIRADRKPDFNPIHIHDAVDATLAALALTTDATLNIAGSEITTFAEIAEFAAQRANRRANFMLLAAEEVIPYYRGDLVAGIDAMQRTLGITPRVTLAQGLAALVDSYLNEKGRD
jgi:nucleoside-diphosphate-sugar epimerase